MKFISGSVRGFDWQCLDTESGIVYAASASYPSGMSFIRAINENAARLRLTVYSIHGTENSSAVTYYDSQAMNLIAWLERQGHIRL